MADAVDAVKKAIERQIGDEGIVAQDGYSVKVDAWLDLDVIARAAIEAYEAAKREERHVIRIENGVVYFSDGTVENPAEEIKAAQAFGGGLVGRAAREASAAIPDLMRGLKRGVIEEVYDKARLDEFLGKKP